MPLDPASFLSPFIYGGERAMVDFFFFFFFFFSFFFFFFIFFFFFFFFFLHGSNEYPQYMFHREIRKKKKKKKKKKKITRREAIDFSWDLMWGYVDNSRPRWLSDARPTGDTGCCGFDLRRVRRHSFGEIDHEFFFSTVILSNRLIKDGHLSISC